jgi:hypothetical protein
MSLDDVMRQFTAELDVCCDALLQAGWPPSRIVHHKYEDDLVCISITPGIELAGELPVFEASYRFVDGALRIVGTWLVDPIPTPHPSTIARGNPRPNPTWCDSCEREISNDTCWCGDDLDHGYGPTDGHAPVPMGCVCFRDDDPHPVESLCHNNPRGMP